MLLRLDTVERRFGARRLFSEVSVEVRTGDRLGLVGPNGAGKTSLLRIASGDEPPDTGRVIRSRGVRVGLLRQEVDPGGSRSVRDEAATALAHLDTLERELRTLEGRMGEVENGEIPAPLAERYDEVHTRFELEGGFERDARVEQVLGGLGFEESVRGRPLSSFSGGWLMRVELAKLLLAQPDVLLLDEPTNHLDLPSIEWFEGTLAEFRGAVVVISHDRTFLRRHANRVAELARGRFELYEGGFDRFVADRELRREQLEAAKRNQDRRIDQQQRFIDRFRYKASKARQVQSRVKSLEKIERIEIETERARAPRLRIPKPARAGRVVMTLSELHKAYGENRVFEGIDLEVERGQHVALVGPNGAGKSTLLRLLAGVLSHERGERTPGHNVVTTFYAQHQLEALDPAKTVLEELAGVAKTDELPRLRTHLGGFLFSGDEVDKKVGVLSGGEKARLALAKMFFHPANFMVLDEPTNHLDLAAREALEKALAGFPGTLVFVSHDRSFINVLANRVIEVRAGVLRSFPGNYDEYRRKLEAPTPTAPGPAAVQQTPAAPVKPRVRQREREREERRQETRARRQIEALETRIEQQEIALGALDARLTDPSVYRDGEQVRSIEADRVRLREEIERATREWEALTEQLD